MFIQSTGENMKFYKSKEIEGVTLYLKSNLPEKLVSVIKNSEGKFYLGESVGEFLQLIQWGDNYFNLVEAYTEISKEEFDEVFNQLEEEDKK